MQICPLAVAWGDIATWLSAAAMFAAVVVTLRLSRRDQLADKERSASLRANLAVPFDEELDLLAGHLRYVSQSVDRAAQGGNWGEVVGHLRTLPRAGIPLIERFAPKLNAFPNAAANQLFLVLSRWLQIKNSPDPEISDEDQLNYAVLFVTQTIDVLLDEIEVARELIRPFAPTDFPLNPYGE